MSNRWEPDRRQDGDDKHSDARPESPYLDYDRLKQVASSVATSKNLRIAIAALLAGTVAGYFWPKHSSQEEISPAAITLTNISAEGAETTQNTAASAAATARQAPTPPVCPPANCNPEQFDFLDATPCNPACPDPIGEVKALQRFKEVVRGFFIPTHPESVQEKDSRAFGNPEVPSALIAFARFLEEPIKRAAAAAGLTAHQAKLYGVVQLENSGGLAEMSKGGCAGPAMVSSAWLNNPRVNVDNFSIHRGRGGRVTFDGRLDPVANLEAGAIIMKRYFELAGEKNPDWAIVMYNQGEGKILQIAEAYAASHLPNIYEQWSGQKPLPLDKPRLIKDKRGHTVRKTWAPTGTPPPLSRLNELLDAMNTPFAATLTDEDFSRKFMPSRNGGRGYISKILALLMRANGNTNLTNIGSWPVVMNVSGNSATMEQTWDTTFERTTLPSGVSLRLFAQEYGQDLNALASSNQHIVDLDATFPQDVKIVKLTEKAKADWERLMSSDILPGGTTLDQYARDNNCELSVLLHINTEARRKINPYVASPENRRILTIKPDAPRSLYAYYKQQGIQLLGKFHRPRPHHAARAAVAGATHRAPVQNIQPNTRRLPSTRHPIPGLTVPNRRGGTGNQHQQRSR